MIGMNEWKMKGRKEGLVNHMDERKEGWKEGWMNEWINWLDWKNVNVPDVSVRYC